MIDGVQVKELKMIKDERGYLMEIIRSDDPFYKKFGQVYMSVCNPGYAKGWHYHKTQIDNFTIVKGNARIVLYDGRQDSKTYKEISEFELNDNNRILLTVPPGVYHGYVVPETEDEPAYMVNTPTEKYNYDNPDEFRAPFDDPAIGYNWGVKKGG
ncbi:dTDP-4-dehydrorhamnose 3,5-epimerase family protein [Patescibacteria group bacterium]|nr:dTDP-4-dehydrorhamnose 3,5-epimerase family protein [Patescibacteria group bacterium]